MFKMKGMVEGQEKNKRRRRRRRRRKRRKKKKRKKKKKKKKRRIGSPDVLNNRDNIYLHIKPI